MAYLVCILACVLSLLRMSFAIISTGPTHIWPSPGGLLGGPVRLSHLYLLLS